MRRPGSEKPAVTSLSQKHPTPDMLLMTTKTSNETERPVAVEVARYPYPYRAMIAICSDLDETPNWTVYREIMRFLNTTESTSMGRGVGLEVGNSIYFMM